MNTYQTQSKFREEIAINLLPKFQIETELEELLREHNIPNNLSITKSEIAGWYGVHRMTLNKWIKGFCGDAFPDYEVYLSRKIFYTKEVLLTLKTLGYKGVVYQKKELLQLAETDYRTMRDNIEQFPQVYGFSIEVYNSLSKFPPNIGQRILKGLG